MALAEEKSAFPLRGENLETLSEQRVMTHPVVASTHNHLEKILAPYGQAHRPGREPQKCIARAKGGRCIARAKGGRPAWFGAERARFAAVVGVVGQLPDGIEAWNTHRMEHLRTQSAQTEGSELGRAPGKHSSEQHSGAEEHRCNRLAGSGSIALSVEEAVGRDGRILRGHKQGAAVVVLACTLVALSLNVEAARRTAFPAARAVQMKTRDELDEK